MRQYLLPLTLLPFLIGCGCSGTVRLTKQARRSIRTVRVSQEVQQPESIDYKGPALSGYDPFPAINYHTPILRELTLLYSVTPMGMWEIRKAYAAMGQALTHRVNRAGIDVAKIVRHHFVSELRKTEIFPAVLSEEVGENEPDAELKLSIEVGISGASGGFAPGAKPWLVVKGVLLDRDNRVVWRKSSEVSTFERRIEAYDAERYYTDPKLFKRGIQSATLIAVADLVRHLQGK